MKLVEVFLSLLFTCQAFPQKEISKSVEFPPGNMARIDARQCYELQLETWEGPDLVVEARMDGEYGEQAMLQLATEGTTLVLSAGLNPLFKLPGDKLGAHKLISIALKVSVPENRRVDVLADAAQLAVHGIYDHLSIIQVEGFCGIYNVGREVEVRTHTAGIYVSSRGAKIEATSQYGDVSPNNIPPGEPHFALHTISGNISLVRTE